VFTAKAQSAQRKDSFPFRRGGGKRKRTFTTLFSFAGVSAAKEKAVDFAVFVSAKPRERDKRAVKYYKDYVIVLMRDCT
jgi:hypothetical protein